jgi:hypothetical protein
MMVAEVIDREAVARVVRDDALLELSVVPVELDLERL